MPKHAVTAACLAVALLAAVPARSSRPVFVRGTFDGARVLLSGARPGDVSFERPEPRLLIVTVHDAALETTQRWPEAEWIQHLRVLGPELLGEGRSRLILRLASGRLVPRLERQGGDTVLVLEGARGVARAARPEPEPEADPPPAPPPREPRRPRVMEEPDPDLERTELERELADTRARLERLERELERPEAAPQRAREQRPADRIARHPPRHALPPAPPLPEPEPIAPRPLPGPAERLVVRHSTDGMVFVPGGSFTMGTPHGLGFEDEAPQHVVFVSDFEIDRTEVTVSEFQSSPLTLPRQPAWNWGPDQPVVNVTWYEAAEYCDWEGKRLPTEAEWAKAARGPNALAYPWGNQWSVGRANSGVEGDGFRHAAPVGSFPQGASPYGALDMSGNVWEWTADWYDDEWYRHSPSTDPTGPLQGVRRAVRGGSFRGQSSFNVRAAVRMEVKGSERRPNVGFRCAR